MTKLAIQIILFLSSGITVCTAMAERTLLESAIHIHGQTRRYYRFSDPASDKKATPILLISGSGCRDFGPRIPTFFANYPLPVEVYFLEKNGIEKGADGEHCSATYNQTDNLEQRVSDALEFIESESYLKTLGRHSLAILGFSEGGVVAPLVAAHSEKIGWLATAGSGGLPQSEEFLIFSARAVKPYPGFYSRAQLEHAYSAIKADPNSLDQLFFGHPYRYWSSHLFYDPIPTYAKLTIPVMAAMGENDDSVPIESGRKLQEYFLSHPAKDFKFIEYKGAGHALRTQDKDYLSDFIAGLAPWFKNHTYPADANK